MTTDANELKTVTKMGTTTTMRNGILHNDNDQPAIVTALGSNIWYDTGEMHRLNGPACVRRNGEKDWYLRSVRVTDQVLKYAESIGADASEFTAEDHQLMWIALGLSFNDNNKPEFSNPS